MTSLANKTALVTGASRGMGRATALALATAGARVIVHYGRNADEAKTVVDQIRAAGGRADAVSTDLAAPDGAHTLAAQVRNLIGDRLDIFVSNAGFFEREYLREHDSQGLRQPSSRPMCRCREGVNQPGTRRAKFLNDFSRAGARAHTRAGQLTTTQGR